MDHSPFAVCLFFLALAMAVLCSDLRAQVFFDDFRAPNEKKWEVISGDWKFQDGGCVQSRNDGAYCYALAVTNFEPRSIEFEATPLERNQYDFCSLAAVLKYGDNKKYMIVRLGSYRSMSFMYWENGKRKIANLGGMILMPGETHVVKMTLAKGRIAVLLDGKLRFVLRDMMPDTPARFGIFTECHCRFHRVTINGKEDAGK